MQKSGEVDSGANLGKGLLNEKTLKKNKHTKPLQTW